MQIIQATDGYKLDHRRQYPTGLRHVLANFTARGSRIEGQTHTVAFGLQAFIQKFLMEEFQRDFFNQPVDDICAKYERRISGYLGPNEIGSDHIRALHNLGYLPLRIRAIPEGTQVPLRVPMFTVENTHPEFGWLVNYLETLISTEVWLPTTSATTAWRMRDLLDRAAIATGSDPDFVGWQGHDFSFRGMGSMQDALKSGAAHLLFFQGTDTVPAIEYIEDHYGIGYGTEVGLQFLPDDYLIGGSVAATEHSVMCAGGKMDEMQTFERLLNLYPTGIVSVVSDTWDYFNVLTNILPKLHDKIMSRDGKLVIRPDSGDPVLIICGDPAAPEGTPEHKGTVQLLWETFGGTTTSTGHKMLDQHIGCIYGDSITYERANAILTNLYRKGFASGNIVFGIGSFTYQYVTRDTFGFAMKTTWVDVDGEGVDIFKDPKTDSGLKRSAKGRVAVIKASDGSLTLIDQATPEQEAMSELRTTWENGKFLILENFAQIRDRAWGQ